MGLDWWTFTAQIVNLFVLIWLLKRFLYRPILETIDKRQAEINNQVQSAAQAKDKADKERAEWEKEKAHFDDIRQKRLNDLAMEEQTIRQQATLNIKKAVQEKRSQLQHSLNEEVDSVQTKIQDIVTTQFMTLSQKVFTDLTQNTPMDAVISTIQYNVQKLSKKQINDIQKNMLKHNVIIISSSIELTKKQQQELVKTLQKVCHITAKTSISWTTDSDLILGLEIRLGSTLLEWNLKNYLNELQHNIQTATTALILSEKDA